MTRPGDPETGGEVSTGPTEAASGTDPEVDPFPHTDDGDDPSPSIVQDDAGLV